MRGLSKIVSRCTHFTLSALKKATDDVVAQLETTARTPLIGFLPVIRAQKAIFAVGMFSMFEAELQDVLNCNDGFAEASMLLKNDSLDALNIRFLDFRKAVNVLKHGRGSSYDELVRRAKELPFRGKLPHETFFSEGDLSEVDTLIEVDDDFIRNCARVIKDVFCVAIRSRSS